MVTVNAAIVLALTGSVTAGGHPHWNGSTTTNIHPFTIIPSGSHPTNSLPSITTIPPITITKPSPKPPKIWTKTTITCVLIPTTCSNESSTWFEIKTITKTTIEICETDTPTLKPTKSSSTILPPTPPISKKPHWTKYPNVTISQPTSHTKPPKTAFESCLTSVTTKALKPTKPVLTTPLSKLLDTKPPNNGTSSLTTRTSGVPTTKPPLQSQVANAGPINGPAFGVAGLAAFAAAFI